MKSACLVPSESDFETKITVTVKFRKFKDLILGPAQGENSHLKTHHEDREVLLLHLHFERGLRDNPIIAMHKVKCHTLYLGT